MLVSSSLFLSMMGWTIVDLMSSKNGSADSEKKRREYLESLLLTAKEGDMAALDRLLGELREELRRYATGKLGAHVRVREDTSDLLQGTLKQSIEDFHKFQGHTIEEWRAYMLQILRNNTKDTLRAQLGAVCRTVKAEHSLDDPNDGPKLQQQLVDTQTSPSAKAIRNELYEKIQPAIAALPPDQRKALNQWQVGYSYQEIAEDLGKTVSAAQSLVKHALQTLRENLPGKLD
jgi:RNA polymerase sigma-70 factor (ECF subfamily)